MHDILYKPFMYIMYIWIINRLCFWILYFNERFSRFNRVPWWTVHPRTADSLCLCIHGATWHLYAYKAISPEVAGREGTVHHKGGTPGCLASEMEPHPRRLHIGGPLGRPVVILMSLSSCMRLDISYVPSSAKEMHILCFHNLNVFDSFHSSSITLAPNIPGGFPYWIRR